MPLQQLAGVTVSEARALVINPYDKGSLKAIEKAIVSSDLGVNPSNDGSIIRIDFRPSRRSDEKSWSRSSVTAPRRAASHCGTCAARPTRPRGFRERGEISSDDLERAEKELESFTHELVAEVDRLLGHKEQELLED